MNKDFYFDGRQIKNYLIGFASIFSEIPYRNRKGQLESVPIHYGSPSDIISYLESNVDNAETTNRNRIKDISIPLLSFRMVGIERNPEKRRAQHDTITVDLRHLGYSTGYVAMRPAPVKFTMELVLWASSDYQSFEIVEQIVPYFNSPQQVTIEPLPKCPVSTTEIYMDSIEIDTDPESQKYSALVTMSFTVTGWLLSQPRIWSTNMAFELSMLDKEYAGGGTGIDLTDKYSVGHDIIDTNLIKPQTKSDTVLSSIDTFVTQTKLVNIYGDKLYWYNILITEGRISSNGQLLNTTPLTIEYKGVEKILYQETMEMLIDDMNDLKYLYTNEILKNGLSKHTIVDDIKILEIMFSDYSDTIEIYMKLLDNNLITKGFNLTDVNISNSDKLNLFGTPRVDIQGTIIRLKSYLAALENLKLEEKIISTMVSLEPIMNIESIFTSRFIELDEYVISLLLHNNFKSMDISLIENNPLYEIFTKKYNLVLTQMNQKFDSLELLYNILINNNNINNNRDVPINIGDIVQPLSYDNNGNAIYDINHDGFINSTDLELLGAVVDDPSIFDFELKYGIWTKRFDITTITEDRILKIEESLKLLFVLTEKTDMIEFKIYLNLYRDNLVTSDYNIKDGEQIIQEIMSLGYNIDVIEKSLTFLRTIFDAVNTIFVLEKDYITHNEIFTLTDNNKEILFSSTQIDVGRLTISVFIEKYLNTLDTQNEKDNIDKNIRSLLSFDYGVYLNDMKIFNDIYNEIKTQDYFINSLQTKLLCVDEQFPYINDKINILL